MGGLDGPLIPELYREFVPSRVTHQEFFDRLFYYRTKFVSAERLKMQGTLRQPSANEELDGWDDDEDEDDVAQPEIGSPGPAEENPIPKPAVEIELLKKRVADLERALELSERQRFVDFIGN